MEEWKANEGFSAEQVREELGKIQGHLVLFLPLHYFIGNHVLLSPSISCMWIILITMIMMIEGPSLLRSVLSDNLCSCLFVVLVICLLYYS